MSIANLKIIAIFIVVFIFVALVISLSRQSTPPAINQTQTSTPSSQPTSYPNLAPSSISPDASVNEIFNTYSEDYLKQQAEVTKQEEGIANQASIVSKFIDKLPITGQFIKVTYNIFNNQVYLEFNRQDKDQASREFAVLLKANQIENVNWLNNLNIIEK